MSLTVKCYPYGPLGENTYLITDEASGYKAVVDPGCFPDGIASEIGEAANLKFVLLTHGHYDHFAAVSSYLSNYPEAEFINPTKEDFLLYQSDGNMYLARGHESGKPPKPSRTVAEGDEILLGETAIKVIETPGHTEGGVCYYANGKLFSGDTLFRLSVGKTTFQTGDWAALISSIKDKLYTLDDDTAVYPGHGDSTSIGYEKKGNPFV